uniref:Uncharacterized protein n=1 Tax=Setaria digitata TaxID=48799 RepID=A0A915PLW8_9BILA
MGHSAPANGSPRLPDPPSMDPHPQAQVPYGRISPSTHNIKTLSLCDDDTPSESSSFTIPNQTLHLGVETVVFPDKCDGPVLS